MRDIERDPWSPRSNRMELPPMWRPGTFSHTIDDYVITYCRDGDDGESLRFLHLRERRPFTPDAM
jgi:hypothetical protein